MWWPKPCDRRRAATIALITAAELTVSSCGGGGNTSSMPGTPARLPATGVSATLRIDVPAKPAALSARAPRYISAGTKSMALVLTPVGSGTKVALDQNLTPAGNPACAATAAAGTACSIAFSILPGSYTGSVALYDGPLVAGVPSGNVLSSGQSVAVTFGAGLSNTISLTLDGIPKTLVSTSASAAVGVAASGDITVYGKAAQTIVLNAQDADGFIISGPGAPAFGLTLAGGSGFDVAPVSGTTNTFTLTPGTANTNGTTAHLTVTATSPAGGCSQAGAACSATIAVRGYTQTLFVSTLTGAGTPAVLAFAPPYTGAPLTLPPPPTPGGTITSLTADAAGACVAAYVTGPIINGTGVLRYQPPYTAVTQVGNFLGTLSSISVDAGSNIFVSDTYNNVVDEFAAPAFSTAPTVTFAALSNPAAITADSVGNVFVLGTPFVTAVAPVNSVTLFSPPYSNASTATPFARAIGANAALALDAAGDLFVENSASVAVYSKSAYSSAAAATAIVNVTGAAHGIAADAAGDLFVAVAGEPVINEYIPPWTGAAVSIAVASGATPSSVAVDGAGDLFVVTAGGSVAAGTFALLEYVPPYTAAPIPIPLGTSNLLTAVGVNPTAPAFSPTIALTP